MKANIDIRQPVNLSCPEALDLQKGDTITCRRCGQGRVEILTTPEWGAPIAIEGFGFSNCREVKPGQMVEAHCGCGGLLFYADPFARWHDYSPNPAKRRGLLANLFGF